MSLSDLDACIAKLRYVPIECKDPNYAMAHLSDCEAKHDDINNLNECIRILKDVIKNMCQKHNLADPLVDELSAIVDKLRTVKAGEIGRASCRERE